jgi:hypothetical protein
MSGRDRGRTGEYDGDSLTASVQVPPAVVVCWMMDWVFVTPIIFTLVIAAWEPEANRSKVASLIAA